MVVHVVRGDGLSGVSAPQMGKVRELANSFGATVHTVVGDDVPATFSTSPARTTPPSWSSGHRDARGGRASSMRESAPRSSRTAARSTSTWSPTRTNRGLSVRSATPRDRRAISWVAAVAVPLLICAITALLLDKYLKIPGETAIFFVGVLLVALLGGVAPAALSAVLSGLLLNYFLTEPRYTFTIAEPDSAITEVVLLVMAVAVAALVDRAANRERRSPPRLERGGVADAVLRLGAARSGSQRAARTDQETYSQRAVSLYRMRGDDGEVIASVGEEPSVAMESADTSIDAGDDEFWLLMDGRALPAGDLKVLAVVAKQAAGLVRQHELVAEAGRAEAIKKTDELRRSLLTAVSHDLRTPLAGAKAAVSSLRSDDIGFSPDDTAELLATIESPLTSSPPWWTTYWTPRAWLPAPCSRNSSGLPRRGRSARCSASAGVQRDSVRTDWTGSKSSG